jgi:hypothetical protein
VKPLLGWAHGTRSAIAKVILRNADLFIAMNSFEYLFF